MMRWCHPLILLVSVALDARGISGDSARGAGLLLTSTSEGNLRPAVQPGDLLNFDLSAMTTQIPAMLMLMVVSLIVVIMSLAGPEMVAKLDLDWDRARSVTGVDSARAGGTAVAKTASWRCRMSGCRLREWARRLRKPTRRGFSASEA